MIGKMLEDSGAPRGSSTMVGSVGRGGLPWLMALIAGILGLPLFFEVGAPPHPGPLTAIRLLKADLGRTLIFGIITAIPTVIMAGPLLAQLVDRWGPLASRLTTNHLALLVLAVGCGSLFLSRVNDAGFWLVKEYFGLSVRERSSRGR
jgi:H+/gluconate symporter-like permease